MNTSGNFAAALDSDDASTLLQRHDLPSEYADDLRSHVAPLAAALARRLERFPGVLLLGINGCQGSGKSTLAQFLLLMLRLGAGLRGACVSIDDFYLDRATRRRLAETVHPLLATRGVPGTHDLDLAHSTLDQLLNPTRLQPMRLPSFDKAIDDRAPRSAWPLIAPGLKFAILEGWCVGCPPQDAAQLEAPVNELERSEDADGTWRRYVNQKLAVAYPPLFGRLDCLTMLAAPNFDCVLGWRNRQEQQLARNSDEANASAILTPAELRRFVGFFERLTRHQLERLPGLCDAVIELAPSHRMTAHHGSLFD